MEVTWTELADSSYGHTLDDIAKKWTAREVTNFMDLVDEFVSNLESGILQGTISKTTTMRYFRISRQTTLFFEVFEKEQKINLLLFWDNRDDPVKLKRLLNF